MQTPQFYPLIPDEAFLLVPENVDILRSKQRLIFEGTITFLENQNQKLASLRAYLTKSKITLDEYWNIPNRLRFLQSCEYNNEKTVKDMTGYLNWIKQEHPLPLTTEIEVALKQGLIYFSGRDYKYRPIIVFDVKKTLDSQLEPETIINIYTFYLDFVVKNLLVEGHVENWVLIVDLNGSGVFSAIGMLKKVLAAMSNRFRCRMHSCHIIRCPGAFSLLWGLVKKFLDDVTIQKISFTSKNRPQNLLSKCNPTQVEKKFNGSMQTLTQYWPLTIKSRVYDINQPTILISVDQYKKLFNTSQLLNQKINKNLVQKIQKQAQKENKKQKQQNRLSVQTSSIIQNKISKQQVQKQRSTIYDLHPTTIQAQSRSSIKVQTKLLSTNQQSQISDEGVVNEVVHFVCNKKPVTFSFYAL